MAFSVRINAIKFPATGPMLTLEPPHWDANELMKDERFKYEPEMAGYADYKAVLTRDEFAELHERYGRETIDGFWSGSDKIDAMMKILDGVIGLLDYEADRFLVTVFEWESGYSD